MDREPNEDSKSLNPSQKDYEQKFDALSRAEAQSSTANSQDQPSDASQLNESESQPSDKQGFYKPTGNSKSKIGIKKRKGPIGLIIGIVFGGGLGFGALFSPALGIVHLKETMVNKMNHQLGSMDARTQRVILSKVDNTTNALCKIKVKCKFKSMSAKQLAKFEKAGFVIESVDDKAFGRKRITSMSFTDSKGTKTTITADNFRKSYRTNPEIRSATHKAYNPKFGGFADKVWTKTKAKFGISERGPKVAATDEERAKNLQENVKKGAPEELNLKKVSEGDSKPCSPDCTDESGNKTDSAQKYTKQEAETHNTSVDETANKLNGEDQKNVKTDNAMKELEDVEKNLGRETGALGTLKNGVKLTGIVDMVCSVYGAVQAVGYGAKTVRAIQLARYAMAFFTVADMIKAGKAKPEDVAYLGTILTSVAIDASSSLKRKTAFDSYGYRYAAYGDSGKMHNYTMKFLAGGGLTGDLIMITSKINDYTAGAPRKTCRTLSNPWVSAGSLIGGVALAIACTECTVGKTIAQAAIGLTFTAALLILPKLLTDIVAGKVTDGIVGEDAGDAITSGAGSVMGSSANGGGNSILTKDQALAYNNLQEETILAYNNDASLDSDPLDIYSPNSFLGSVLGKFYVGFVGKTNLSQYGTSLLSFINGSFSSIIPRSMAASDSKMAAALEVCQDYDYKEMGIATDPFCNPIFGIPPEYLDADPDTIIDSLISNGYIDENGDYQQKYNTFIESCVNRTEPFGGVKQDNTGTDGSECKIEGSEAQLRAYAYIHQIDNRVEDGMDGYEK